ncbi:hypothetical protein ACFVQ9_32520 [Streptomyces goshikiensis]|uniref:hypothetical protein n=1 Tax=Streptomyces goshikiensis TaxID=1942 RepID=UPI003677B518
MNSVQNGAALLMLVVTVAALVASLVGIGAAVLVRRDGASLPTAVMSGVKALGGALTILISVFGVAVAALK